MKSNESAENYLETILVLSKKLPVVRSVDIANELGFKKSSVSIAMKNLREKSRRISGKINAFRKIISERQLIWNAVLVNFRSLCNCYIIPKMRSKLTALFVLLNIVKTRSVVLHSHYSLSYHGYKHLDSRLSHSVLV